LSPSIGWSAHSSGVIRKCQYGKKPGSKAAVKTSTKASALAALPDRRVINNQQIPTNNGAPLTQCIARIGAFPHGTSAHNRPCITGRTKLWRSTTHCENFLSLVVMLSGGPRVLINSHQGARFGGPAAGLARFSSICSARLAILGSRGRSQVGWVSVAILDP